MRSLLRADATVLLRSRTAVTLSIVLPIVILVATSFGKSQSRLGGSQLIIGLALTLGIGMRIAAGAGAALLVMMWSAVLPPANNLFMDDHIVYALVLVLLALIGAGKTFGFGRMWERIPFVAKNGWLK